MKLRSFTFLFFCFFTGFGVALSVSLRERRCPRLSASIDSRGDILPFPSHPYPNLLLVLQVSHRLTLRSNLNFRLTSSGTTDAEINPLSTPTPAPIFSQNVVILCAVLQVLVLYQCNLLSMYNATACIYVSKCKWYIYDVHVCEQAR